MAQHGNRAFKIFLTVICMISCSYANANFKNATRLFIHNFEHYTSDQGLTSDDIRVITKDSEGKMWIGTNDGVSLFDGYSFKPYLSDLDDPTTICGKTITAIKETSGSSIFMLVKDGGVSRFDKHTGKFRNGEEPTTGEKFNTALGIETIGNNIYIAFREILLKYNKKTKESRYIKMPPIPANVGIDFDRVKLKALPDSDKIAILWGHRSIGILNTKYETIKELRFESYYVRDICAVDSDRVMIASDNGLSVYSLSRKTLSSVPLFKKIPVRAISKSADGSFWVAYDDSKLVKWNPKTDELIDITNFNWLVNDLSYINEIYEDENNILWIGTNNSGVIKLDIKPTKITHVNLNAPIRGRFITHDLNVGSNDHIWIACGVNGVLRLKTSNNAVEHIKVPHRNVYSVLEKRSGEVFIGTTKGPIIYNKYDKTQTELDFPKSLTNNASRVIINTMCEDCLGNIWFGTQIGLFKYNGNTLTAYTDAANLIGTTEVIAVYEDFDGRIWVGTKSGVFVRESENAHFSTVNLSEMSYAQHRTALCFYDYGGDVLIGTRYGVSVYNKQMKTIRPASFNKELKNSIVYSIVCDTNGTIWLRTNSGIASVNPITKDVHRFNHRDGLGQHSDECKELVINKDRVYICMSMMLNYVCINNLKFNTVPAKTIVSSVVYGQSDQEAELNMKNDSTYQIKFLVKASLKIRIASSDFTMPYRNNFMYSLDDDEWRDVSNGNEILLSGLAPGTYKIEIKSTNSDKVWTDDNKTIYVTITPPLWGSSVAIVFYLIMTIAIIWLLLDFRFREINKKMKHVETEAKAKRVVEAQRNRLAKIHKDQTDSINYAKRIQESIMPKETSVLKKFSKIFVCYKPKDIVSGDFYCFYHRDDKTFIVAADCTGHGVPGAFLSIFGIDHLSNIIMKQKIDDAGEILNALYDEMHSTVFKDNAQNEDFNDGMDLTICVVYHKEKRVNFAGAMGDMYLIRNNEILTFRGDHYAIGFSTSEKVSEYTGQNIECQSGDIFYMFSDGYVDQFGGPEQKKFKHRRFKHLLMNIHKLPAKDQKIILNQKIEEWKSDNEQTDDISVIGFEPWA